ncbi:nitrous oxide-stimulated promoter family protein [Psychromonas sp. CD1]|uniref:nitrous oxide-stimulated promoter family protein n=1 Tax=Psychromonas sp. CD1 TaxID=1979839 RepID=UPI000B9B7B91|nr:nitrous oxide-stimulated promoter family protein [Psychromonas sp. CD1]
MYNLSGKLGVEFKTIHAMVNIYCQHEHRTKKICEHCQTFLSYANKKLDRCPYGQIKPICSKCPIHCYKKKQREQAQVIMRYAGPKMLLWHPLLAFKHLVGKKHPIPKRVPEKASHRHHRKLNGSKPANIKR